jgi:dephospho-CoA kinase
MSNPPIKLALAGKLRAGKDTAATYLSLFYDFQPFALADEGKRVVHQLFPDLPLTPKPRKHYQVVIDSLTKLDLPGAEEIFVNLTLRKINDYIRHRCCKESRVLVTDVRKQVEYDRLRAEGFVFIRINADEKLRIQRALEAGDKFTAEDLAHETELLVDLFPVDYEVLNNGSTTELYAQLDVVMRELGVTMNERKN